MADEEALRLRLLSLVQTQMISLVRKADDSSGTDTIVHKALEVIAKDVVYLTENSCS